MARSVRKFNQTRELQFSPLKRIRSHRYFPAAVIGILLIGAGCLHIWQRVTVIEMAKEVSTLRASNRILVDDVKKIQSDIASLSSATRIEQFAVDSLGMTSVSADRLYTLVRKPEQSMPTDELDAMISSIRRVADYLPAMSEANANSRDVRKIRFETTGGN